MNDFDGAPRIVVLKAHDFGEFGLNVERKSLFRPSDEIVQAYPHVPEKGFRFLERLVFFLREDVVFDESRRVVDVVEVFSDPVERLQVAQAAFAFLDVGLDEVAAFALPRVPLVALREFCFDKILTVAGRHFGPEFFAQFFVELLVAPQISRFQYRRADRDVLFGEADAFAERSRSVANLQAEIPKHVEDEFDDALAPGRLLERTHKQQIDVGTRRQLAAAITAGRDDGDALGGSRVLCVVEMLRREIVENLDRRILQAG